VIALKRFKNNVAAGSAATKKTANAAHDAQMQFASPASTSLDELVQLRSSAMALQRLTKKRSSAPAAGVAVSRRLGRGLDFAEVRSYQAGDDVRMIDWKVTARTGSAHTKLFVEERERPVIIVVDFRSSMRFGTQVMFKSVLAARLASLLGWSAANAQDRVGGFVFTDDWHTQIRPQPGRRGLMKLFRGVIQAQMHAPADTQGELALCLSRLRHVVQTGSSVILLSDFAGFNEEAQASMGSLLPKLDVVAVHISDPIEKQLPAAGRYSMRGVHASASAKLSIETGNSKRAEQYAQSQAEHAIAVKSYFSKFGALYLPVSTQDPLLNTAANIINRTPDRVNDEGLTANAVRP